MRTLDTPRTRLVLASLLLAALSLVTVDLRLGDASPLHSLRGAAAAALGPVERAAAAVTRPVSQVVDRVGAPAGVEERVTALQRENDELRLALRSSGFARARARQLDELLRVASVGQYRVLPAQVIARGPAQGLAWTVGIDAGRNDGITTDMTVLNGDGLVGRVRTVSATTATVLLAVDPGSSVGVRLENLETGVVTGRGREPLLAELFDPTATVRKGDRLVTWGSRGAAPFVPGVPVGEVVAVQGAPGSLTKRAVVRPYVDAGALDLVGVVVAPPRRDPRNAVLPPPPTPVPTPTVTVTVTPSAPAGDPADRG